MIFGWAVRQAGVVAGNQVGQQAAKLRLRKKGMLCASQRVAGVAGLAIQQMGFVAAIPADIVLKRRVIFAQIVPAPGLARPVGPGWGGKACRQFAHFA